MGGLTLWPNDAIWRQRSGSTLAQVMAYRLFGAKPLPEPMMTYCLLDSYEQSSVKILLKLKYFH